MSVRPATGNASPLLDHMDCKAGVYEAGASLLEGILHNLRRTKSKSRDEVSFTDRFIVSVHSKQTLGGAHFAVHCQT